MSADAPEVRVTRWQSGLMLTVAVVVIVHSAIVGLWLSPVSPLRDTVGSSTLASYVNPYFRQSPTTVDPGLQRADEALLVRARVLTADGETVETAWVDLTADLESGGLLRPRMDRAARSLATNLNVAIASFPESARPLVEGDLLEEDRAIRQVEIEAEGATPFEAQVFFANWAMATQFGTLVSTASADGTVEQVQIRIGLRRVPPYDERGETTIDDEPYTWVTLGWRDAIAGNEQAQEAFDDYVEVAAVRDTWWVLVDAVIRAREASERWLFGGRHALVALGLCRILLGLSVVLTLLVNFSDRTLWVGNASVWAEPARDAVDFPELWLVRNATDAVVTVVYLATTLAALALTAGWYTRAANVVTLIGFIAVVGQNPMVGSASDNAVRLALLWLVLTSSGDRCSVDARQRARRAEGAEVDQRGFDSDEVLPPWLGVSLHNIGLLGLGAQTVLLYVTAGLDKIAREAWRSGEALYYTTQLPEFRPFPVLSDLVSASPVFLAFLTYLVLLTQLFFAPLMLTRVSRIVTVTVAIVANVFFAIVFGAVPAALAIIAVTLVVFPDDLLEERVDWLAEVTEPVRGRVEAVWFRVSDPFVDAADSLRSRRTNRREQKAARKIARQGTRRSDRASESVDAD